MILSPCITKNNIFIEKFFIIYNTAVYIIIFNIYISKMKKLSVLLCLFSSIWWLVIASNYSVEYQQAYHYAYQNGITTMNSIDKADMNWQLNRIAMAKMLSNYAINILWLTPDTNKNCHFSDVSNSLDAQYDNWVTKACQLGLMGVWINQFNPNVKVTRAEFGTALSRALNAKNTTRLAQMNNAEPYYYEHLKYLQSEGIMNNISNPGSYELRWRVMLMLMRADKNYVPEEIVYPTTHTYSANKIDTMTRNVHTEWCNWVTEKLNDYNTYHYMPNKNRTDDVKFVNKALQDVRDNGEYLVKNYIDEANRVLDSAWLTKKDQCRYSLLIDNLESQKWYIKSYKTENGKTILWIDFISYKESISWDDMTPYGSWHLLKNTSTKARYYTLNDGVELEILNVDKNWYTNETYYQHDRKYVSNWNIRLNSFCNNEPVYNWERQTMADWEEGDMINRNEYGLLCTKTMVNWDEEHWYSSSSFNFRFDDTWTIDRISWLNYRLTNAG